MYIKNFKKFKNTNIQMNTLVNDLSNQLIYFYQPKMVEPFHLVLMIVRAIEQLERMKMNLPSCLKKQIVIACIKNTINQVVDNQVEIKEMLCVIETYGESIIDVIISTSKGHYYINSNRRKKKEVGCCNIA